MNILGTEISSKTLMGAVVIAGLVLFSMWFHSQAIGMGFSPSSMPCAFCH